MITQKITSITAAVILIAIIVIVAELDGYYRCHRNIQEATLEQKADDKAALVDIKDKQIERQKRYDDAKKAIKSVPDSNNCVNSPIPVDRVKWLHDLYSG